MPVEEREPAPALERLIAAGRVRLATRAGYRPRMRTGDGAVTANSLMRGPYLAGLRPGA